MSGRNRVQALIPETGRAIPNRCGTAPGVRVEINGTPCYALPGVPFEMEVMFTRQVLPEIQAGAAGRILRSRRLNCFGMPESVVNDRLADLLQPGHNPTFGTTAQLGVIGVQTSAYGEGSEAVDRLLDGAEAEVRARLGAAVFGRNGETLAVVVGNALSARGETLSIAESCTGGLIAKMLTDVPGSSAYFVGGAVAYADELKQQVLGVPAETLAAVGAVSEPAARAMAEGARRAFATTYGLSTTGIAGPTGGTPDKPVGLVFIALATPGGTSVRQVHLGDDAPRAVIREWAARIALNLLRLHLVSS
jgi:nicotinamide-nucleotide amidase